MNSSLDQLVQRLAQRYTAGDRRYAQHWQTMLSPIGIPLLDDLPLLQASRVPEVDCGPGTLTEVLRQQTSSACIAGIDNVQGMIARTSSTMSADWCRMNGRRLRFKP